MQIVPERSSITYHYEWSSQLALTIEGLDAVNIISGQNKGVRVSVAVHRVHESTRVIRVGQAQGMSELMGSHYEEDVSCSKKTKQKNPMKFTS